MAMLVYWRVGNWFAIGGLWKANSQQPWEHKHTGLIHKQSDQERMMVLFRIQNRVGFCKFRPMGMGQSHPPATSYSPKSQGYPASTRRSKKDAELMLSGGSGDPGWPLAVAVKQLNLHVCLHLFTAGQSWCFWCFSESFSGLPWAGTQLAC